MRKKHVLFDNRIHGYDGVFCRQEETLAYKPHFKKLRLQNGEPMKLEMEVAHDPAPTQIRQEIGELVDDATCSNAFGWICVRRVDEKDRRRIVLDYETA